MSNILIAFITGLTTGGLSCLAVQGGLLASSLAQQLEQQYQNQPLSKGKRKVRRPGPQTALPILLFLSAKVVAYTLLGFLLGLLGSVLQLTSTMRAILMIIIGIFMVGNGLRMLDVHPIFRYFVIEPPSALTRYIRRTAKNSTAYVTPLFLGALTVLIPCGVTQAMMAVAVGTGDPLQGAAILFAFTLGASPLFFAVAYLATQLGAKLETLFMRLVAVVVLVLGLVSVDAGLTLVGSPLSVTNGLNSTFVRETIPQESSSSLMIEARNNGYYPAVLYAKAGEAISLTIVTDNTRSCSRDFVIPSLGVEELLPSTGSVKIDIPAQEPGSTLRFSCSMGMYTGKIVFDQGGE